MKKIKLVLCGVASPRQITTSLARRLIGSQDLRAIKKSLQKGSRVVNRHLPPNQDTWIQATRS